MTFQELADRSGYHRVSLSRLIRSGLTIPGVTRGKNGRVRIDEGPELFSWLKNKKTWNDHRYRRLRRVKDRWKSHGGPEGLIGDYYTSQQMAILLGESVSSLYRWRDGIPGARVVGKRLVIEKTPELAEFLKLWQANSASAVAHDLASRRLQRSWQSLRKSLGQMLSAVLNLPAEHRANGRATLSKNLELMQLDLKKAEDILQAGAKNNGSIPAVT
jgi:hypothetical protein